MRLRRQMLEFAFAQFAHDQKSPAILPGFNHLFGKSTLELDAERWLT